jgi:hypothetical protein
MTRLESCANSVNLGNWKSTLLRQHDQNAPPESTGSHVVCAIPEHHFEFIRLLRLGRLVIDRYVPPW